MVNLDGTADYLLLFGLAAFLGGIGGLTYELLLTVRGRTGAIERPGALGPRHIDLGVFASVIVGAVAAVASLWIFPPEIVTTVVTGGESTTTSRYDIIKVVGLSLIVGSAGGSFLSAMQARALALVKTEQANTTKRVANDQLKALESEVARGTDGAALTAALANARSAVAATGDSSASGNPDVDDF